MNYSLQEIQGIIVGKLQEIEASLQVFKYEYSKYNDVFHTDDKFEVKSGEYWRARILGLQDEKADLEEILKTIEDIMMLEEAEEDHRENSFNARFGI